MSNLNKRFASFLNEGKKMKGDDPCWDSHKMVDHKNKNGKKVPNCVPKEEVELEESHSEDIDYIGDKATKAHHEKKFGVKIKKNSSTADSHDVVGPKHKVRKFLVHHYESESDAKDIHPHAFKEEVEQIDELSQATLKSYAKKAQKDADKFGDEYHRRVSKRHDFANESPSTKRLGRKAVNREDGMYRADGKLGKKGGEKVKVKATEEVIDEKLHGDQKKLDHNKNGKLDKQDFKHVRKKGEVKEEEQLDELSNTKMAQYVKAASRDMAKNRQDGSNEVRRGNEDYVKGKPMSVVNKQRQSGVKKLDKAYRRQDGIDKAVTKMAKEDTEQLDELSDKTVKKYVSKSTKSFDKNITLL